LPLVEAVQTFLEGHSQQVYPSTTTPTWSVVLTYFFRPGVEGGASLLKQHARRTARRFARNAHECSPHTPLKSSPPPWS
jgi:hypothetical protein